MRRAGPQTGEDSSFPPVPSEVIFAFCAIGSPAVELSPIASSTWFSINIRQRLSHSTFATFSFVYCALAAMAGTDTISAATASNLKKRMVIPPFETRSLLRRIAEQNVAGHPPRAIRLALIDPYEFAGGVARG